MAKLTMILYRDTLPDSEVRGVAMLLNHLLALIAGRMNVDDFHDEISECPQQVREYYYELLFEEK